MRIFWVWAVAIAALIGAVHVDAASAQPQKRMALVIGMSNYSSFAAVRTAEKDAADIGAILNLAGFEVVVATNLTSAVLKQTIQEFNDHAKGADLVAFYFGGQAIETGGENYLLPVDAPNTSRQETIDSAISVGKFLGGLPGKSAAIVFLDAPRTDPFPKPGEKRNVEAGRGRGPSFVHIAYATAPGRTLTPVDGANSAYATAFLKHIKTPSLPLRSLDNAIRQETMKLTKDRQTPWTSAIGNEVDVIFFAVAR